MSTDCCAVYLGTSRPKQTCMKFWLELYILFYTGLIPTFILLRMNVEETGDEEFSPDAGHRGTGRQVQHTPLQRQAPVLNECTVYIHSRTNVLIVC